MWSAGAQTLPDPPREVEPAGFLCPPQVVQWVFLLVFWGVLIFAVVLCIFRCSSSIFSYYDNVVEDTFCYHSFQVGRAFVRGERCVISRGAEEEPAGGDSERAEASAVQEPSEQNLWPCGHTSVCVQTRLFLCCD